MIDATMQLKRVEDGTTWDVEDLSAAIAMLTRFYAGKQRVMFLIEPFINDTAEIKVVWFIASPVEFNYVIKKLL